MAPGRRQPRETRWTSDGRLSSPETNLKVGLLPLFFMQLLLSHMFLSFMVRTSPLSILWDGQCSNLNLDDPNPMENTPNTPKQRQEKQRFARWKHWNHMRVTDRPRPDAPSPTQTIIVQMVYSFIISIEKCKKWKQALSAEFSGFTPRDCNCKRSQ